jgi:aspartyl-tRNA(Asn)/glutamyl-tRNA(Gln) amidotransferase subunit C
MSGAIDLALLDHIATLASLSLAPEEREKLAREVSTIVAHVRELDGLDTTDVPPTAQIVARSGAAELRPDEARPCLTHAEALGGAPRAAEGGFVVPPFVDGDTPHRKDGP